MAIFPMPAQAPASRSTDTAAFTELAIQLVTALYINWSPRAPSGARILFTPFQKMEATEPSQQEA